MTDTTGQISPNLSEVLYGDFLAQSSGGLGSLFKNNTDGRYARLDTIVKLAQLVGSVSSNGDSNNQLALLNAVLTGGRYALLTTSKGGGLTPSAPAAASVGVASAEEVAANANRKGLVLVNTSANTISLAFGTNAAVLNSGITLNATGGTWVMDEHTFTTQAVNGIAGGAASNLAVQEFT